MSGEQPRNTDYRLVLRDRVERAILERIDPEAWHRADAAERAECESLHTILNAWPGISRQASNCEGGGR